MRNTSALHWILLVALLAFPVVASAQKTTDDQEPVALHNPVISADGAWMAAEELMDQGDGNVRVWSTEGDKTFTIERGHRPRISRDSRWVSALQKPPLEKTKTDEPKNKRAGQTLVLLDTQDGSRRTFDFVLSYDVTYFSSHVVYLQSPEAKADEEEPSKNNVSKPAAKSAVKRRKGGTLQVVELVGDRVFTWQNVTQYAAHQATDHGVGETWKKGYAYVAFVTHDEESGRDRLEVAFVGHSKRGWGSGGTYDGEKIEGLCWARDSVTLGFLDSAETTVKDGKPRVSSALYTWHDVRGRSGHREFTRVDSELHALHNPVISPDGAWVAAEKRPERGDGNVRVWSTEGDKTFTIERGFSPRISRDSRWVSALQKPPLEKTKTAKPKNERAGQTLILLDTQDGSRRTFDFVLSYDMTYSSTYLLYLKSPETKADEQAPSKDEATKPATRERKAGTLHQIPLNPDRLARIGHYQPDWSGTKENVVQFATHPTNDHFAYVFHDEETGGDTLHIVKWGIRSWYKGDKIEGLCWAGGASDGDESITFGFLDSTETTGKDGKRRVNSALYSWQPGQSSFGKFKRVDIAR